MDCQEKQNFEILDELDRICAEKRPVHEIKAQIADALKALKLPEMRYQNRIKYIFTGKNDSDALTTLFVVATAWKRNELAAFLLEQKMAKKNAVIVYYDNIILNFENHMADTLPHMAVRFNNVEVLEQLEKAGVSMNRENGQKLTPEQLAFESARHSSIFMRKHFMQFVHSDTPEHNSDMYLFAHDHGIQTDMTMHFAAKRCVETIERICGKPEKEPVATKVATQKVQRVSDVARQNVG